MAILDGILDRPDETDANWRMKKSMCQVIQLVLWPSFGSYFVYHDAGIGTGCSARLFDADSWCETGRPLLLKQMDVTAIALIFALFLTNPAPICVLDEVDAPLDDANIERFCDLLDAMVAETDTRYLIVTHNAVTMSRMHRLFGVTMVEKGVSRLVSVDLSEAELMAAE